jgi:hypothetical protein
MVFKFWVEDGVKVFDADGRLFTMDLGIIGELSKLPADAGDIWPWYAVEVTVSGRRTRGCPPAPRSFSQGGDPGERPTIEDLSVVVTGCPLLSAALEDKYRDVFVEALLREGT